LAAAGVSAEDIDLIICATVTSDWRFPATACLIQSALGSRAAAFDLNAGCSGFLFALAQADSAIRAGAARRVLVIGCDVLSRITDYSDPKSCVLFGDGAGAAVINREDGSGRIGPFILHSDGSRPDLLYAPSEHGLMHMEGGAVYRAAVEGMSTSVASLVSECGLRLQEVDLIVAHQANQRILDAVVSRLGVSPQKAFSNIARYGNTSAASIPIALFEAQASNRLADGDLVVVTAFGAGFAWGSGLLRWGTSKHPEKQFVAGVGADA
jgi:3-oxoacyl-[acyl-carrier-protein] synthase-3